eukprot:gene8465-10242_t
MDDNSFHLDFELVLYILIPLLLMRYAIETNKVKYPAAINYFKVLWFLSCSINEYLILFRQPFLPTFFGGQGDYPYKHDDVINPIYAAGLAFHLHNTITSFFVAETRAMYIHHVVTLSLILGSAFHGTTCMGSFVLFVHNIPDIFIALAKASTKYESALFTNISGGLALITWPIFRMYFLGKIMMHTLDNFEASNSIRYFYVALLTSLLLLHMFWYFLLVKIFLSFKKSGEALDTSEHPSQRGLQKTKKKSM